MITGGLIHKTTAERQTKPGGLLSYIVSAHLVTDGIGHAEPSILIGGIRKEPSLKGEVLDILRSSGKLNQLESHAKYAVRVWRERHPKSPVRRFRRPQLGLPEAEKISRPGFLLFQVRRDQASNPYISWCAER